MSVRTDLSAALRANLPRAKFDVKDVEELPDTIRKTTVMVRQRDYVPAPNAGTMFATFIVTVASHHKDRDKAEDALDGDLGFVLEALQNHLGLTWSRASRVLLDDTYLAYDVEASIPTDTPY